MSGMRIVGMAMRYSQFVPRLYNLCLSLGLRRGRMMPSRAFCSDESQGYPTILIAQHFGTFPFDHGRVGGKVAINRHGPHADHGDDVVIIHASHVGYDSQRQRFGVYPRLFAADSPYGHSCGKLCAVMAWYREEYDYARANIAVGLVEDRPAVFIDNHLLEPDRREGLFPHLDRLIEAPAAPLRVLSTAKAFAAAQSLVKAIPAELWRAERRPIGNRLTPDLFFYRRDPSGPEGQDILEAELQPMMPTLMASPYPALDAARFTTQIEFDRTYRSIQRHPAYRGKNLLFVSGLNIDVSPLPGLPFPLTEFVPWAACLRLRGQEDRILEQAELFEALTRQSADNPDQMSFDAAISAMGAVDEIAFPRVD
jgi:hypothetical protein